MEGKREYGTNGNNGTNGKILSFPFVPYSLFPSIITKAACVSFAILLFVISLSGAASSRWQSASKNKLSPVRLIYPNGLALDGKGDLYISDIGTHRILKLNRLGRLTVIAGTGNGAYGGDGGPAIKAQLHSPHDLAFDDQGNLFVWP